MSELTPHCQACGTELAPNLLTCPTCRRLVHSDRLKTLAESAANAASPVDALAAWREALELLPPGTRQYGTIQEKITQLGNQVDSMASSSPCGTKPDGPWAGRAAGLGAMGLVLWKFKAILLLALTKGKML